MKNLTTILSLCLLLSSSAQVKISPYEIGIHIGTSVYEGDLVPTFTGAYKSASLFWGINGAKVISNSFAVRASLSFGRLKANDANYSTPEFRKQRNFNFTTPLTELSVNLNYTPLENNRKFFPYLTAGAGLAFLKISRDYSNLNEDYFVNDPAIRNGLPIDIQHSLPRILPVLPIGVGLRFSLNDKLSLDLQSSYRLMWNDYLDGFSQGADPDKKDHYFTHTIGLIYSFGEKNRLACPK